MRFDCGPTWAERRAAKEQWHRFFAVFPRRLGSHDCRWMEWIERKGEVHCGLHGVWWTYEYRAVGSVEGLSSDSMRIQEGEKT